MTLGSGGGHSDKKDYLRENTGTLLYRYLDTDGDGTGTKSANGNYSAGGAGATEFFIQPPANTLYVLHRMIIHIHDSTAFSAEKYGALAALANGISVTVDQISPAVELVDLTDGIPIKSNAEWGQVCFDVDLASYGQGDVYLNARWTFSKAGQPVVINENQKLAVTLNDDLTGLVDHYFMVQGYSVPNKIKV
jgi:hypothetical protein